MYDAGDEKDAAGLGLTDVAPVEAALIYNALMKDASTIRTRYH